MSNPEKIEALKIIIVEIPEMDRQQLLDVIEKQELGIPNGGNASQLAQKVCDALEAKIESLSKTETESEETKAPGLVGKIVEKVKSAVGGDGPSGPKIIDSLKKGHEDGEAKARVRQPIEKILDDVDILELVDGEFIEPGEEPRSDNYFVRIKKDADIPRMDMLMSDLQELYPLCAFTVIK